ncbi:HD domain-containing protein [Clostridiaceae bacterium DONG20-135]|uniref:HD domain-containing protein n=1 Tax=Copranaerobaculum intestinale TaxID=2692629 RepID=A0A6N8U8Q7_9FIRM|nr:HD domain-containing protein [Copranaerobaculum intestinale]
MKLIDDQNVMYIVRNVLDAVDNRLVAHGERVAYLVWKIMAFEGRLPKEIRIASELALMHDIGAFKTDEIDSMLTFDCGASWDHAIYGYVFLKYLSPLEMYADCVLYHHLPYEKLAGVSCSHPYITSLIHLCDRIDVLSRSAEGVTKEKLASYPKGEFDEQRIRSFFKLEEAEQILRKLSEGTYQEENNRHFQRFRFSEETKVKYLEMLAYSIDFNSEHMVLHTIMTVALSVEIARFMGLPDNDVEKIKYGSLLHDIGKVKIPMSILEKAGSLNDEEMKVMRNHVVYSEEILSDYLPRDIYLIAVRHHEKLNGRGYPHGLCADDLTISERIVAIADITSALLGKRSYKEKMSQEKTLHILHQMGEQGELDIDIINFLEEYQNVIFKRASASGDHVYMLYQEMLEEYHRLIQEVARI